MPEQWLQQYPHEIFDGPIDDRLSHTAPAILIKLGVDFIDAQEALFIALLSPYRRAEAQVISHVQLTPV